VKEETRYRVTGSLFLLALAVVFLPMLFDGAGLPTVELPPVEELPVADVEAPEPEPPPADLVPRVEALRDQIDAEGFDTDTRTQVGEPVLSEAGPETQAWAVQVASFADVENAKVFRSRLQEDGYEAFLSTIRSGDDVRTRVAVGPVQNRTEAASLQEQLSTRYRVNARLMAFST
jgi:DedD protein